jgi:hypothetical protein
MAGMRELTPEEKAKPYSKYYDREHAGPTPELAPLLAGHSHGRGRERQRLGGGPPSHAALHAPDPC